MVGVPAASAATTAALVLAGVLAASVLGAVLRRRLAPLRGEQRVVACAVALTVVAVPWVAWRFAEDLATTTKYDAYERANLGPIQAFLPGYLLDGARARIGPGDSWATVVGPSHANPIARQAFPALALASLFPRVSAQPAKADWIIAWGASPAGAARVERPVVVHPAQGPLPPVVLARRAR